MILKLFFTLPALSLFVVSFDALSESKIIHDPQSSITKAFLDDGKLSIDSALYIRHRSVKDKTTGKYGLGASGIKNQTGNISLNYKSGYYKDVIGVDFLGGGNIKLGNTIGQSEILYYDYQCGPSGKFNPCEKSFAAVAIAAFKINIGDINKNFKISAGYTPINSGTIKGGWGLSPHTYRGFDSAITFGDHKVTYAWADRFKNDWSRDFKPMTTSWHQNNASGLENKGSVISKGHAIDYIHSVGSISKIGNAIVDIGYGEGKDYRRNWQALIEFNNALSKDKNLKTRLFYHGSKYMEKLSGIQDPTFEYYAAIGLDLKDTNTLWSLAYSQNYAPNTRDYNFRLTPWANSDKRDYQPTDTQLGDTNASGAKALRFGVSYNFTDFNLPELTLGTAGAYARHIVSDVKKNRWSREYNGKSVTIDLSAHYKIMDGAAEGLSFRLNPAILRMSDSNFKTSRNDIKFIASYSIDIF